VADLDAAGEHQVAAAAGELGARVVDGDERAGARGVDRVGRAVQVEPVGDARRGQVRDQPDRRVRAAGAQLALELGANRLELRVVEPGHDRAQRLHELLGGAHLLVEARHARREVAAAAEDHAGAVARHGGERRVVERVRGRVEGQQLVRLGGLGGDRHDPVGERVEPHLVADEAAALAVEAVRPARVRVVEDRVPARRRHVGDRVDAVAQVAPVAVEVGGAGEDRGHPDDGETASHSPLPYPPPAGGRVGWGVRCASG